MQNNKVLATVGGKEITQNDVEFLLKSLDPQTAKRLDSEDGRKRILQELVNQELFYLDAIEKGFDKEADYIAEIERMKASYLKQYSIGKLLNSIKVENNEIESYYTDNKSRFTNSESIKASHILVNTEESANDILKRINEGLSFEDAAREYSSCPSKSNGGDLGYFTKGRMVPEFENAAFEMSVGEISGPVKTQFGYHLIKVEDRTQAASKTLEEVKDQIMQQLMSEKQENMFFNKINELKGKYEVKTDV